jgi:hypothetical protein
MPLVPQLDCGGAGGAGEAGLCSRTRVEVGGLVKDRWRSGGQMGDTAGRGLATRETVLAIRETALATRLPSPTNRYIPHELLPPTAGGVLTALFTLPLHTRCHRCVYWVASANESYILTWRRG